MIHSVSAPKVSVEIPVQKRETPVIDYNSQTDEEIVSSIKSKRLAAHSLEKYLPHVRAVHIRRVLVEEQLQSIKTSSPSSLKNLPYEHYDYSLVTNQCCENVIGYIQVPVGYAGPLRIDGKSYLIPMATTEGSNNSKNKCACKYEYEFSCSFLSNIYRSISCKYKSWM